MTFPFIGAKLDGRYAEKEIIMMTTSYPRICLLATVIMLAGCAQDPEIPALKNQVGQLSQKLQTLTNQALAAEQQNTLNRRSLNGVYLLPAANTPAVLNSSVGKLGVSLTDISSEANGSQALLHIRSLTDKPLPAMSANVEWGQLDPTTGQPLTADVLSQPVAIRASLLPKTEHTIELRLSGLTPEQLGFIRFHQVVNAADAERDAVSESLLPAQ